MKMFENRRKKEGNENTKTSLGPPSGSSPCSRTSTNGLACDMQLFQITAWMILAANPIDSPLGSTNVSEKPRVPTKQRDLVHFCGTPGLQRRTHHTRRSTILSPKFDGSGGENVIYKLKGSTVLLRVRPLHFWFQPFNCGCNLPLSTYQSRFAGTREYTSELGAPLSFKLSGFKSVS